MASPRPAGYTSAMGSARLLGASSGSTGPREGAMFEIWQHRASGARYLVVVYDGAACVAAGPLPASDDPRRVLETHGNQSHNPKALVDMRRMPEAYRREYTTGLGGHAVAVPDPSPTC